MAENNFDDLAYLESEHHEEHDNHAHADASGHHEASETGEFSFSNLLEKNTGDHMEWAWFDAVHVDLPKIIIDDGLHIYKNTESMEEAGLYTMSHHKIVNAETHEAPMLDMSITSLVLFQFAALIILATAFFSAKRHYKKNPLRAPKGFAGMLETVILFVRNDIGIPNMGKKLTDRLLPYLLGVFTFILVLNLFGLMPGGHTATSNIAVTATLAIVAYFVIQFQSFKEIGLKGWLKNLLGGAPWYLGIIMVPIEIISMFIKPFALAIRLFANMTAGHLVLISVLGLIFVFQILAIAPVLVGFTVFVLFLELLVAFIQAFIFTLLTAIFVGLASHDH